MNPEDDSVWQLASRKEMLPRRLGTPLLLGTLDQMLRQVVEPLLHHTDYFRRLLAQTVLQYQLDRRRKFNSIEKGESNAILLLAMVTRNYDLLNTYTIDRALLVILASRALNKMAEVKEIELKLATAKNKKPWQRKYDKLCAEIGLSQGINLYPLWNWCQSYLNMYNEFKWMIISKYVKLAFYSSSKATFDTKLHIDKKDLFKNLVFATERAVDKCDAMRGTLTANVQNLHVSAINHPEFAHQFNVAYSMPAQIRRQKVKEGEVLTDFIASMPPEDQVEDLHEKHYETNLHHALDPNLLRVLRQSKRTAVTFLGLGLPIELSDEEKQLLQGQHS